MRPIDPRLLRRTSPARRYLGYVLGSGFVMTGFVVAQAVVLAHLIANATRGAVALRGSFLLLLSVLLARGLLAYAGEVSALRAAAAVRSSLRRDLAAQLVRLGPQWSAGQRSGSLASLMTLGLDSIDGYFARYLPQLVLATFIPVVVVVVVAGADPISAVTIGVTLPLIPVFMVLVGLHTKARTGRQWAQMSRLGGHFLDVVEGLPTLKAFGRAKAQVAMIRTVSEDYRRTTMSTLRIAFTSALVLELLATLATALVAVEVGLRLLAGQVSYETALLVLLLAPEAYLPLRSLGASFHASADGVAAVSEALSVIETPISAGLGGGGLSCDLRREPITLRGVSLRYPTRSSNALTDVDLEFAPGESVALVGQSGAGKSTLLALLLGFASVTQGEVQVGGRPLRDLDLARLRQQIAWVPQSPRVFAGTLADNIRLGAPDASHERLLEASRAAGIESFVAALPGGYATVLGDRGLSLSTGQRQRLALARAFLRDAAVILLDEPGAHLDETTAGEVRAAVARLAVGRTLVLVTHDERWHDIVDRVVVLREGQVVPRLGATIPVAAVSW